MDNLKVVFWGTSEFAVLILDELARSPWKPSLVVSTSSRPAGRGRQVQETPVTTTALRLGIASIQPDVLHPIPGSLQGADLFIVASYGKILPHEILAIPKFGALNVHPSLLPRWRGPSPIQATLLAGDSKTGVTIMRMDEEVDHGPILAVTDMNVEGLWTRPELERTLAEQGGRLLIETIPQWIAGRIIQKPQDEANATYSRKLSRDDGQIRWEVASADEVVRMLRAYSPWPGVFGFWHDRGKRVRLEITDACISSASPSLPPGTVFESSKGMGVMLASGAIDILSLKPEGRIIMASKEFLRGHPDIIGTTLD